MGTVRLGVLLSLAFSSYGQDERLFRKLFNQQSRDEAQEKTYTWEAWGKVFSYDLDGDGALEGLQMVKRDQEDWFYIRNRQGRVLGKYRLQTKGRESGVYRIKINKIGDDLKLLGLYFYDGFTESSEFYGTASLYFLTYRPSQLGSSMVFTQGPSVWLENKTRIRYLQRNYGVVLQDLNRDGIKEVVVHKGHTKRVFQYSPKKGMQSISF